MSELTEALTRSRGTGPALMTHVVLGYPSYEESLEVVRTMAASGAAAIELQMPFSDPMADGPTIMFANEAALGQGITPPMCMKAMEQLAGELDIPLFFMGYFNTLFRYGSAKKSGESGLEAFLKDASAAGAKGLIVPDIPPEETAENYWGACKEHGLAAVPTVTPVTSDERLKTLLADIDDGFVYCVSVTGTTGARSELPTELGAYLSRVRKHTKLPLGVGFGISKPEQVKAVGEVADIAIVGSAAISLLRDTKPSERLETLARFVESLSTLS